MRRTRSHFEAAMHGKILRKIEARVWADYDRACERGDIERGQRYAARIDLVAYRIVANAERLASGD